MVNVSQRYVSSVLKTFSRFYVTAVIMNITVFLHVATCGLGLYDNTSHNTSRMLNLHDLFLSFTRQISRVTATGVTRIHSQYKTDSSPSYLQHYCFSFHFERWIITLSCYHDNDVTSRVTFIRSPLSTAILYSVTIDGFSCRHFTPSSGNCCKTIRSTALINGAVKEDADTRWLHMSWLTKYKA